MSIRIRLVIMCLVVALLPAIPTSVLVKTLLEKSFHIGLNPTVEDALQSGLAVSRSHLGALHADFENAVDAVVDNLPDERPDSAAVAGALARGGVGSSIDGFLTPGAAGLASPLKLPAGLSVFARHAGLPAVTGGKDVLERTGHGDVEFYDTRDRSVQMAVWRPRVSQARGGSQPVLFYKRTDPEFMTHAGRILECRQIFAQLRLEQPTLSRSFFYPFILIYGVILVLSLGFALLMAERLSDPIRRLAHGANIVARGDWSYRLRVKAGGEIRDLMTAFNEMVSRLDTQRRRLIDMEKMTAWRDVARHLAHEIKNPLLPIRLTVEELKDQYKGGDPAYQELVDESARVVGEEIDQLQALVREFSSFARMPKLKPRPGSLEALLRDVATLYSQTPVRVVTGAGVEQSVFDRDQMRRAVINLLDNAVAAVRDSSEPSIEIRLERKHDDVLMAISDNGPGIAPDMMPRIFEPYFTTKGEGTGLGLAIVKNIVLLHGGTIDVSCGEDGGTTFVVAIPLEGPEGAKPPGRNDQSRSQ